MSTDKTLADAQPGGRVRLGDQAERARFEAWAHAQSYRGGNIMADRDSAHPDVYADPIAQLTWKSWQAALSAQPSPGGQDALAVIEELAELNRACAALDPDYKGPSDAAAQAAIAALASRQPVEVSEGEFRAAASRQTASAESNATAEAMIAIARQPADSCTESECVRCRTHPDHRGEMGHAGISDFHQPVGEPVAVVGADFDLFWIGSGPIAPLVERNGLRPGSKLYAAQPAQAVDLAPVRDVFRRWHANELNSTDAMLALVEALAVIDSQAVGK
ncbi:hypothetical protein ACN9MD_09540 [Stenotrophomonas maltophilia]|uniref:hypothetical protein n=1 Tax=Stenotrophomonas maltophilia TaxID=40324 RepID=UPI003CE76FFD